MPRLDKFPRPQVLAHRMLILGYPENTILSLRESAKLNIDWVEFDVKVLKDGTLVSMHDGKVDRTTDGKGNIVNMDYKEVSKLNAGKGYNFGFVPVPKVEDILKELAELKSKGRKINAEMHIHNLLEPEPLLELLDKYDVKDLCYFNTDMVAVAEYIREDLNDVRTRISFNWYKETDDLKEICNKLDISYICINVKRINKEWIDRIHNYRDENPVFVHCYPVHNETMWQKMIDMGVDVIQTDFPEALIEYLKEKGYKF